MKKLTDAELQTIWEEVCSEFPDDEMTQEIHYVRRVHAAQTKGLSMKERIGFYQSEGDVEKIDD